MTQPAGAALCAALAEAARLLESGDVLGAAEAAQQAAAQCDPTAGLRLGPAELEQARALLKRCVEAERQARGSVVRGLASDGASQRAGQAYRR